MDWEIFWVAVAGASAAASFAGSFVSWWRSNISRSARKAAEEARDAAERTLQAAETSAHATQKLAEHVREIVEQLELGRESAPLEFIHLRSSTYRLRNTTGEDIVIEQIDNEDMFFRLALHPGIVIPAGGSVDTPLIGRGRPTPGEISLGLTGVDSPMIVPIPPKSPVL